MMPSWLAIFAQEAGQQGGDGMTKILLPMMVFMGLMFILSMRANSRQKREMQNALANLKKNDKVVTSAGILGAVVAIKENEDEVTLRVDDTSNTRIRVLKSSIVRVTSGEAAAGEAKPA